jgi:hypothetical protein
MRCRAFSVWIPIVFVAGGFVSALAAQLLVDLFRPTNREEGS